MTEPGLASPAAPPVATSPMAASPVAAPMSPPVAMPAVPAPAARPPVSAPPAPPAPPATAFAAAPAEPEEEAEIAGSIREGGDQIIDEDRDERPGEAAGDSDGAAEESALGLAFLLPLAVVWLAATMWSAHASIAARAFASDVLASTAALALPAVIASSVLAGATIGLAAVARWARRGGWPRRLGVGFAAGTLLGLAAAGVILAAYGAPPAVTILAVTVGSAAALGGVLAAIGPAVALAAGIAATLADFAVATLLSYFQSPLKPIFGEGGSIESQAAAADRFAQAAALIGGLTAGLVAFAYLRRRASAAQWPLYLLAGALPGLLALLADAITRVGGGPLLRAVAGLSVDNARVNAYLDTARINGILIVGFVGAISATVAVGLTMRRPVEEAGPGDEGSEATGEAGDQDGSTS